MLLPIGKGRLIARSETVFGGAVCFFLFWTGQSAKPPILPVRRFLKHTGFLFATLQVSGGTLQN